MSKRVGRATRAAVEQRADDQCEYCGTPAEFCPESFAVEHVIPRSRGGGDQLSNLALSCQGCNSHKYDRVEAVDPISGEVVSLFNPRTEAWADHFEWVGNGLEIAGRTPAGRATVAALCLNRRGVVNLRRLFQKAAGMNNGADNLENQS